MQYGGHFMETTLVLLKPDALERGLVGCVLERLERAGLRVIQARYVVTTLEQWKQHYADLEKRNPSAYKRSVQSLAGQPVIAFLLKGSNAILKTRALAGATEPSKAAPGTIRGDFSSDSTEIADAQQRSLHNLLHASDSPASVKHEMAVWFPGAQ